MKKTLIYGAIGGVALYLYLQLQKKKKLSTKETSSTKEDDASGSSILSGTGGIKPPKPITPPVVKPKPIEKVPPMSVTTPRGEGDGVSVKNDAPTPPAPTVEPVYGGIKPSKPNVFIKPPLPTKEKPIDDKPRMIVSPKPPVIIKPIDRGIYKPKDILVKEVSEDELGRPIDINTGRQISMPQPIPFIPKPKPKPINVEKSPFCKNLESRYGEGTKVQFGRGTVIQNGRNLNTSLGISQSIKSVNKDCISGFMEKYAK